jgi:hypothetical protein
MQTARPLWQAEATNSSKKIYNDLPDYTASDTSRQHTLEWLLPQPEISQDQVTLETAFLEKSLFTLTSTFSVTDLEVHHWCFRSVGLDSVLRKSKWIHIFPLYVTKTNLNPLGSGTFTYWMFCSLYEYSITLATLSWRLTIPKGFYIS